MGAGQQHPKLTRYIGFGKKYASNWLPKRPLADVNIAQAAPENIAVVLSVAKACVAVKLRLQAVSP